MKTARLLIAALAAAFVAGAALAQTPPGVLVVAKNIDDIVSLDPAQAYEFTSGEVVSNIYSRLVQINPADLSKLDPDLAESWTVSEDGKSIVFKLRAGATFSSGNPVRPEDVVFSFKRVVLLKKPPSFILAQLGWTADSIDRMVRKTGDSEVTLTLGDNLSPAFALNAIAARPGGIVDEKAAMANAKDNDLGNAWVSRNSAGSGPFVLRSWRPNEVVVLEANPTYHAGAPKTRQVVLNHVTEPTTQRLMIERGDIDIARNLGPDQIDALKGKAGVRVETHPGATIHFLSFNVKHEKLKNPALWEAARHLVDYDGIADKLMRGQFKVHQTFWPAGFAGSVTERPYTLDVAKAKDILAKGNIAPGLSIDMDIVNQAPFPEIAQSMQSTFAQAGIKLNLLPATTAQVVTRYRARAQEALLLYWGPDFMDPHSNAKAFAYNTDNSDGNYQSTTTWRNSYMPPAEISKLTMAALAERDAAKRLGMYRELQRHVLKDSPWVTTFQAQWQYAIRDNVKGFVHGPFADYVRYDQVAK
jgi:peptide/nickel transport system substrate-binding protein